VSADAERGARSATPEAGVLPEQGSGSSGRSNVAVAEKAKRPVN
jgi:hypothetical protein